MLAQCILGGYVGPPNTTFHQHFAKELFLQQPIPSWPNIGNVDLKVA